ncbi:MAG: 4Fe-4S cluster-binding domain-containing protein [Elusimicrobia bacterium]|nr:4Fe-4S cluster-binding domain-containing protein [Elusimicrobiota bacterium]
MRSEGLPATGPGTLDVFLNNRCNLACVNCCVAVAKKPGEGRRISWDDLRGGIDYFLDDVPAPLPKTVLFAGGEPLLDAPLLLRAVEHIRAKAAPGPEPVIMVFTNGTLLEPGLYERLRRERVRVFVSLDGRAASNDRYRRFRSGPPRSVFDAVSRRLEGLPRDALAVNMVVRPEMLPELLGDLRWFHAQGIKTLDVWLDYFSQWSESDIARLARFFVDLKAWCRSEFGGALPFEVPMSSHALLNARALSVRTAWWRRCDKLVLGPDGSFYDCEGCLAFRPEEVAGHRIGSGSTGVDWAARGAYMDRAAAVLDSHGAGARWQHVCPRVYYRVAEQTAAPLGPLLENLHRVSEVFCGGFAALARAGP